MLFKLSLKNTRKGIKDYAIYFVTLVLGIAIFYIFNSLEKQTSFMILSNVTAESLRLMMQVISGMSVFIAFILGFLIVYASRFLMRRRTREFAIYMTLGMKKSSVAGILSMENLLLGLLSLATGLAAGIILSQLMSTFVARLFEADMTEFTFTFSSDAFLKTILYFGIIMIVVLVLNLILVGNARLIRLIQSGVRVEKVKVKNPVLCSVFFAFGAACLTIAYLAVTAGFERLSDIDQLVPYMILGVAGTFLIFWSVSGFSHIIFSRFRGSYYKGLNSFTFRQFSNRINTMVISISVICIMLFCTIGVLSSAFSLRTSLNQGFRELTPVDVCIGKTMQTSEPDEVFVSDLSADEAERRLSQNMAETLSEAGLDPQQFFSEYTMVSFFNTADFTLSEVFGSSPDELKKFPQTLHSFSLSVMTESDYNKVAQLYGNESVYLAADEYAVVSNMGDYTPVWNRLLSEGESISVFGHELKPGYSESQEGFVRISSSREEWGLIIIPDTAVDPTGISQTIILGNYNASDKRGLESAEKQLFNAIDKINEINAGSFISVNTKLDIRGAIAGISAIATFVGLYLGFVFLISCAAILALKALSDSIDSRGRYNMLRKIGADEKAITGSLLKQHALLFMFPLLLAVIHSFFGLKFSENILRSAGIMHTTESMLLTAAVLIVVYAGYFLITFFSSKKIIKK